MQACLKVECRYQKQRAMESFTTSFTRDSHGYPLPHGLPRQSGTKAGARDLANISRYFKKHISFVWLFSCSHKESYVTLSLLGRVLLLFFSPPSSPFSDPKALWPWRHLIRVMWAHDLANKETKTHTFREHPQIAILKTCDPCNLMKFLTIENNTVLTFILTLQ